MARTPKQLPAWFLYDEEGSRLFELICQQPEYSLTRTETCCNGWGLNWPRPSVAAPWWSSAPGAPAR
jgi:hypothetical protein